MTVMFHLRRFSVTARALDTGEEREITVTLSKDQLRAAQLVGQSSRELIQRELVPRGMVPVGIGSAEKKTISLDLDALFEGRR